MRRFFNLALVLAGAFLFVFPQNARAQFTTVTATVTDANGIPYAGAVMNAILVPGASGGYTLQGNPYSGRVGPVTLDSAGKFTAQFGDVTLITPGSPQWQITIDSAAATIQGPLGTGPQSFVFTSTGTTISGGSLISLTTALNALAPKLTNFITSGATIGGSIANTQVAFGSGTNTISGNAGFIFISPNLSIPTGGAFEVNSTPALALPGISGGGNVAVGGATLPAITSGIADIAIGPVTMTLTTSGSHNIAIGAGAMNSAASTASNNTAVGDQALANVGTSGNTGVGQNALNVLSSGTGDVAIGENAGVGTNGSNDTLVGTGAGSSLTGSTDILIGTGLGSAITSGNNNIGIGNSLASLSPIASNQLDLGDVVLGTGINTPSTSTITFPGTLTTQGIGAVGGGKIVIVDGQNYALNDVGINAAIVAAGNNGKVIVPPGAYPVNTSKIVVNAANIEVAGYGVVLTCNVADDCVFLNSAGSAANTDISFKGFLMKPGTGSGGTGVGNGFSAIRDNGQTSRIEDINFCGDGTHFFDHGIRNDNDQSQRVQGIDTNTNITGCTAQKVFTSTSSFVGSAIYGPGPTGTNAGIIFLSKSNISLECSGNGIDWHNANSFRVEDTVIQGFNQFAIRNDNTGGSTVTDRANVVLHNVYREIGACTNPFGNVGQADTIMQGGALSEDGGANTGSVHPLFVQNGTTGSTTYLYWIVAKDGSAHPTQTLSAGYLTNGNATLGGSNTVTVVWPKIATASTYDLLRVTGSAARDSSAPTGTGNYAVTTGFTQATCGTNVCTFTDNVPTASLASYTVSANTGYVPSLSFWPGTHILSTTTTTEDNALGVARCVQCNAPYGGAVDITTNGGNGIPTIYYAPGGLFQSGINNIPYTPVAETSFGGFISGAGYYSATLLPPYIPQGATVTRLKGILNLGSQFPAADFTDIITLADANYWATVSQLSHRPASGAGDMAICQDASISTLCFRAATSISNYINATPDGSSWTERLTSALKSFTVPVKATAYQTATNCSSSASPAVCGSAAAGTVALPTNAVSSSLVVNTTAVTANSEIFVQTDDTLGTKLGITCNSTVATLVGGLTISARTAGTSFTIANNVAVVTNPLCVSYHIIN